MKLPVPNEFSRGPKQGLWGIRYGWWVVICLVYAALPLDFLPELILGPFGLLDDLGMAGFGLFNFVKWWQGRRQTEDVMKPMTRKVDARVSGGSN